MVKTRAGLVLVCLFQCSQLFLLINSLWVVLICEQIILGIPKLLKWALYYAKQDKNGISGANPTSGSDQYKQNSP